MMTKGEKITMGVVAVLVAGCLYFGIKDTRPSNRNVELPVADTTEVVVADSLKIQKDTIQVEDTVVVKE